MGVVRRRGNGYMIDYYNAVGKRRWETIGPNKKAAEAVLAQRMWDRHNGKFKVATRTCRFEEFAAKWFEDYCGLQHRMGRMKPSTLRCYRDCLAQHITPFFGTRTLDDITLPQVNAFTKTLLEKALSPKTVGNILVVLKEMLKHAVQWGYLAHNPAQHAPRPPKDDREMEIYAPEDLRRLLEAATQFSRWLGTLLLCAVTTGLRRGELLGLKWDDIDWRRNQLHVRRSLYKDTFVTPKSARSKRAVNMPPSLREALWELPSRFRGELVFCQDDGKPLDPDNLTKRDYRRAVRRAGLHYLSFHSLRHAFVSLLIAHGAHPKYIQAQVGHASIQTTLDRYGHLMLDVNQEAAKGLDAVLFGQASQDRDGSKMVAENETGLRLAP